MKIHRGMNDGRARLLWGASLPTAQRLFALALLGSLAAGVGCRGSDRQMSPFAITPTIVVFGPPESIAV